MTSSVFGPQTTASALLELQAVQAAYGQSHVLFGVDLHINAGECVTLLGRNGMGKSTTVKTITGLHKSHSGAICLRGRKIMALRPHQISRAGIGLVPEGRRVFPNLTVQENLIATARPPIHDGPPWSITDIYAMFPRLKEREHHLGCNLSGGEQQMVAIGRALMTNPELLILDEATEGLAPIVRKDIWLCVEQLKRRGLALLVIDKNLKALLRVADRHYIMEKGTVVWKGTSDELRAKPALIDEHIGM